MQNSWTEAPRNIFGSLTQKPHFHSDFTKLYKCKEFSTGAWEARLLSTKAQDLYFPPLKPPSTHTRTWTLEHSSLDQCGEELPPSKEANQPTNEKKKIFKRVSEKLTRAGTERRVHFFRSSPLISPKRGGGGGGEVGSKLCFWTFVAPLPAQAPPLPLSDLSWGGEGEEKRTKYPLASPAPAAPSV